VTLATNIAIGVVAALHLYFLILETFLWDRPYGRRVFGLTPELSKATKSLAANLHLRPHQRGTIWSKSCVAGNDCEPFNECLRNQHPVEWITVVSR
jgi:hypothetical protein